VDLLVIVPTYNEAANLPRLAAALLALDLEAAAPEGARLRLMVVDDASTDGTGRIADDLAARHPGRVEVYHREAKEGLGRAYIAAFGRALAGGAELIAHMDADLSHDPARLPAMLDAIRDADLVIGSRYTAGGAVDRDWSWYRKLLSWSANRLVVPAVLGIPVRDATSGYRLWRREALARVDPAARVRANGYGFLAEMAYLASRLGLRIREVPIHFQERAEGASKMTPRVQLRAVREILAIRWRHRGLGLTGSEGGE
jgi:dolichol-phosphate mannosyltransferase